MDAALDAERLAHEVDALLGARDFEAAEEVLAAATATESSTLLAFVHLQYARLYRAWNKLSSAVDHLQRASEVPDVDPFVRLQIARDLGTAREERSRQRP